MENTLAHIEQITQELTWPIRQAELNPELPISAIKLDEDNLGTHLGLFHNNQLITVISLFQYGNELQFRKFATSKAFQSRGFGSQMMAYILDDAAQQQIKKVWCNARSTATHFYEKFGFSATKETFTKNDIHYIIMEKIMQ